MYRETVAPIVVRIPWFSTLEQPLKLRGALLCLSPTLPYVTLGGLLEALRSPPGSSGKLQSPFLSWYQAHPNRGYRRTYGLISLREEPLVPFAAFAGLFLSALFRLSAVFLIGLIWCLQAEEPPVAVLWVVFGGFGGYFLAFS